MTTASPREAKRAELMESIRGAARSLFLERGFDGVGVRDIAAAAGVNHAIVIRHFGTKESLFLETVALDSGLISVLDGPIENAGALLAAAALDAGEIGWRTYSALIQASSRPEVRTQLRTAFEEGIASKLVNRLDGADARLRVHLFTASFVGLLTSLATLQDDVLHQADRQEIATRYGASMQMLLTPPASSGGVGTAAL